MEVLSRKQWAFIVLATVIAFLFAVGMRFGWHETSQYTCLQCRADLHKNQWFGIPFSHVVENDCSRWFAANHALHHHEWCWSGSRTLHTPISFGYACGRRHPIWTLSASTQLRFMQTASTFEVEAFWQTMRTGLPADKDTAVGTVISRIWDNP